MSPSTVVFITRISVAFLVLSIIFLVFSPFSGLERKIGLSDLEAHLLAMFSLSSLAQLSVPWMRRRDIATICLCFAAVIEVVQPIVGRDGNLLDFLVGAFGVFMSIAPMMVEEIRRRARERGRKVRRSRFDMASTTRAGSTPASRR